MPANPEQHSSSNSTRSLKSSSHFLGMSLGQTTTFRRMDHAIVDFHVILQSPHIAGQFARISLMFILLLLLLLLVFSSRNT
jgi:hypothetical protein